MATLSSAAIDDLHAAIMQELSNLRTAVPVSKSALRAGIVSIDSELSSAETTIFQNISNTGVKTWLQANQAVGRRIIAVIEQKRKEEL
jgi:hypothetical protein